MRTTCVKKKDHQNYKLGKCKSKMDETVPGIEPGHLELIGGKSVCIKRGKQDRCQEICEGEGGYCRQGGCPISGIKGNQEGVTVDRDISQ